ncbi:glutamine--fructose-6-phosphate transaminase (isomerizing) [Anaerococcus degeneri]|uniref:Glutamine--fructose-6-phosphate aminotransferase [isomerizing] n=1 Tax=Anaerococcus degeneri TaxID=361500 RepID=A0ABS7YX55_9FIRM|nr:glutamine--fructose-6-phosphate transaminase (isomerizing) [Anaerococcus degeneri]MBP2016367.1 glucosamine--fructose-6-phosphate aminotransferase (isomerizing) [Anaerococcus degeneri]MCA2096323.1 glutamine--fructose-6-phosphate transaminase (isomerizing) [Anaerococcus degeneri]
MCGIVCYKGRLDAREVIVDGLEKLEYRGYDSAGLAVINEGEISFVKKAGKIENLKRALEENPVSGNIGIGHIRWATHGEASDINSHPHLSNDGRIAVVHNGIIENYRELKKELEDQGYTFKSTTDTEVIAVLVEKYYEGDLLEAVEKAKERLEGSFACGIISVDEPERLIGLRVESPLVLGLAGDDLIMASDIPSLLKYTKDVIYLENGDLIDINGDSYTIYDENNQEAQRKVTKITWSVDAATKDGYDHFMIKEINEQGPAIKELLKLNIKNDHICFDGDSFTKEEIEKFKRIYIVACGTAYNVGLVGKWALEKFTKIPVFCDLASEFRYNEPFLDENTLVILISQSGETADSLKALRLAKDEGAETLLITNTLASSMDREADKSLYCYAGPEIAVASTKAYTTQIVNLYLLALDFANKLGRLDKNTYEEIIKNLREIPERIDQILKDDHIIKEFAEEIKDKHSLFFIGRGLDYATSIEAALKLKEVSYIHTEAFAAGELKHGTISLIEENTPVIAIMTQKNLTAKTLSNVEEVVARGANVFIITSHKDARMEKTSGKIFEIPETMDILYPLLTVIPAQLMAYYTSIAKGIDVDKPRNLAKSVTVE